MAGTTLRGRSWLKFTLLNPNTTVADIHGVLDLIREIGRACSTRSRSRSPHRLRPERPFVGGGVPAGLPAVAGARLLAHDLAFMPRGENVILVLDGHTPSRVFMKDIGEEVAVMNDRELAIFTDAFDGVLRHLAAILDGDGVPDADEFWSLAGDCVGGPATDHPELAGHLDLLRPTFKHSCLYRLQLRNTLQMVDLADQAGSLMFAGELENPVARTPVTS